MEFAREDTLDDEAVYCPMVFIRPFKFFVDNHRAILESLVELEAQVKTHEKVELHGPEKSGKWPKARHAEFEDEDLLQDLRLLVDFLDVDLRPTVNLRDQIKDGSATEIEYADLWHLFERGDLLIHRTDKSNAYRVVNVTGGRDLLTFRKPRNPEETKQSHVEGFLVECTCLSHNGLSYVPRLRRFVIPKFYGTQRIASLLVYPLRFSPEAASLRTEFLANGKRFVEITRIPFCHKLVRGKTLDEPSTELEGQVIIDTTLAVAANEHWRLEPSISVDQFTEHDIRETTQDPWCTHEAEGCCGSDVIHKDYAADDVKKQEFFSNNPHGLKQLEADELTDDDLMSIRPSVHAFVLRSRRWVTVMAQDLSDVVFENSFDDLVLPENHGSTVRALVETHESSRGSNLSETTVTTHSSIGSALDVVKGKGTGLIILLHGEPGVGKTSTAECVADETRRPLYPITCGDIGETAAEVEEKLQYNFRLADKWGCVLLLDEADVFLAKRNKTELRHNAVTSVFLRSLEYYGGILFLTTNRVGDMDPAFKSRIRLSLFYPKLSLEVTKELYKRFVARAEEEQDRTKNYQFKIDRSEILKFAKAHYKDLKRKNRQTWNGRQIRNAFQTAIALTEHRSKKRAPGDPLPVLGAEQFKVVASGFEKFDEYLVSTLGFTESYIAKRDGLRDDAYMAHTAPPAVSAPRGGGRYPSSHDHRMGRELPSRGGNRSIDDSELDSDSDSDSDDDSGADRRGTKKSGKRADKKADYSDGCSSESHRERKKRNAKRHQRRRD